jgi:hypothetical protein
VLLVRGVGSGRVMHIPLWQSGPLQKGGVGACNDDDSGDNYKGRNFIIYHLQLA